MDKEKKKEGFVLLLCLVIIVTFVFLLPSLSEFVRDSKRRQEETEEFHFPTQYRCRMAKEDEIHGYTLNQDATYSLDGRKVIGVTTNRKYTFETLEEYEKWKEDNQTPHNVKGKTETISFQDASLTVNQKITKDILIMDDRDLEDTFPKIYENLLIYTQDQSCEATYDKR